MKVSNLMYQKKTFGYEGSNLCDFEYVVKNHVVGKHFLFSKQLITS